MTVAGMQLGFVPQAEGQAVSRPTQSAPGAVSSAHASAADEAAPKSPQQVPALPEPLEASASVPDEVEPADAEARSVVDRRQLDERLPRSAPDALRYEPGLYIQQTAHGQASPYVRGMTGQRVVHVFDGVRLNNGLYRQGPNQYFFTVDARTLQRLEVIRGSASTRFGSDALGGAILATARDADFAPDQTQLLLRPRAYLWGTSADRERGGRAELATNFRAGTTALLGLGYRHVGLLRGGGVVANPGRLAPMVPRLRADGKTQLGTGFRAATFDGRVAHRLQGGLRIVGATYGFRQLDAPRTDQCPPPEAPEEECLRVDKQFRSLAYVALRGDAGAVMREVDLSLSWQRHDEHRTRDRPRSFVAHQWRNRIDTLGLSFRGSTRVYALGAESGFQLRYGAAAYRDGVGSRGWQTFTDLGMRFEHSRGQYIEGSRYTQLGAFTELVLKPVAWLKARAGGRLALVGARAVADPESGSSAVRKQWPLAVGRLGLQLWPGKSWSLAINLDQGFRAPNLDDLTSRQQVGPGFQFENAALQPERSATAEMGVLGDSGWLRVDFWGFATRVADSITRALREARDCPDRTPSCAASRGQFQLVNATEAAWLLGLEGAATAYLPGHITLRASSSLAWGEGPNTGARSTAGVASPYGRRAPLSRVPPLNGTLEARWRHLQTGAYLGAAARWAFAQRRLAPADHHDARIPEGGTPGYFLADLRAGWRASRRFRVHAVFENLLDAPYRIHGSSVNGAGRGLRFVLTAGM